LKPSCPSNLPRANSTVRSCVQPHSRKPLPRPSKLLSLVLLHPHRSLPHDPIAPPPVTPTSPAIPSHCRPGLRISGTSPPLHLLSVTSKHPLEEGCARPYVSGGWPCGRSRGPSRLATDFDSENLPLVGRRRRLLRLPQAPCVEPSPPTPDRFTHAFLSLFSSVVLPCRDIRRRELCLVCRCEASRPQRVLTKRPSRWF
jgi:hypothetical protein